MVVLWLAVLLIVGCGADDATPTASIDRGDFSFEGTGLSVPASPTENAAVDRDAVPASPISGGGLDLTAVTRADAARHVFIAPISPFVVVDPVFGDYYESADVMFEIFAGLTSFTVSEAGAGVGLDMASSHEVYENGTVHTFVLRQGLRFSDGSPVTALDFKWSWERALRVAAETTVATQAEWVLDPILGAEDVLAGEAHELAGVDAVDERTLVVTLRRPRTDLRYLLAHPAAAVLKRENVEGWTTDWTQRVAGEEQGDDVAGGGLGPRPRVGTLPANSLPVGTGPFRLVSFDDSWDGERYVVERNEFHHGDLALLDGVHFDGTAFERAFEHGDGTYPNFQPLLQAGEFDVGFGSSHPEDSETWPTTAPGIGRPLTMLLALNPSVPPLDNLDFRRALAQAIDPNVFSQAWGSERAPPTGIAPPGTPGYSEVSRLLPFDLDAANEAFSAYVAGDGFSPVRLPWTFSWHSTGVDLREVATEAWEAALPLEVAFNEVDVTSYQEERRENRLTVVLESLRPRYPHPSTAVVDLREVFGEAAVSPELDRVAELMDAAAFEPDPVVQLERYGELERYLLEQALVIPLVAYPGFEFAVDVQPWVHGFRQHANGGSRFKGVWFDETYPGGR